MKRMYLLWKGRIQMRNQMSTQRSSFRDDKHGIGIPRLVPKLGGSVSWGDILLALRFLINRHQIIEGPSIIEYERAFAQHVGVRYGISFSSGRVALYALLRSLGVGAGDEVLLQVPTHIVVANAIQYTGATPVFVDCKLENYNMDLALAEKKISPRTRVLILQHTFGIPVDLDAAIAIAQKNNIIILEDCVHSLGATYGGRQLGSFGKAAFFSTEETKTISSSMGGIAVTDDPELAKKVFAFQLNCPGQPESLVVHYLWRLILYHIFSQPYLHPYTRRLYASIKGSQKGLTINTATEEEQLGLRPAIYEQRYSNAQAAIALRQLRRLGSNIEHRRKVSSAYYKELSNQGFILPCLPTRANPAFVRFPVWVDDPQPFFQGTATTFQLGEWFTSVLEESASPTCGGYDFGSCPNAEASTQHLVNLPTHQRVKLRDVDTIIRTMIRLNGSQKSSG